MAARKTQAAPRHRTKPDPLARAIGSRVRKLRLERGWVFDAIVGETGLGRGYISELERGLVVPTVTALAKIADVLEVSIADLVLGDSVREKLFEVAGTLSDLDVKQLLREAEKRAAARPKR